MRPGACPRRVAPYQPYLLVGYALALLILTLSCTELIRNLIEPTSRDFISFWGAARLVLAGRPELAYDGAALHAVQAQLVAFAPNGAMPFPYAPAFLLLVLPFAVLPFPIAMGLWSLGTLCLYALVARRFAPQSGWLAVSFPPVFSIAAIGQNGFLTAACFLGGLILLQRGNKFQAGLLLGCMILKPQLALMLPVAMLAGREWRVIAGSMVSAAAVLLLGIAVFGPAVSSAWLGQMPLYSEIAREGLVGWPKLVSIYAACRQAGMAEPAAWVLHCAGVVLAASLVARAWRSDAQLMAKAGVLGAATMLASPYVYEYDALVLIPTFAWLVQRRTPVAVVGALWLVPILSIAQMTKNSGPINVGPLLPMVLLALCYVWGRENPTARRDEERPPRLAGRQQPVISWLAIVDATIAASRMITTRSSARAD